MHLPLTLLHDMGGLPGLELQAVMSVLAQFFLATIRIGAFLVTVPVFGAANVPLQVRIILSALLGVVVMVGLILVLSLPVMVQGVNVMS